MKRFLLLLFFFVLVFGARHTQAQPAGTVVPLGGTFTTNISALSRGPDPSKAYQRVIALCPVGDSALTGLKAPREFRTLGRFMVEAELLNAPLAVRSSLAPAVQTDIWPNPVASGHPLHMRLSARPTGLATVLDITGRTVWRGKILVARPMSPEATC